MKRTGADLHDTPDKKQKALHHWWEEELDEQSITKWTALEHHGVLFPPGYKPHGLPVLYEGRPVVLTPELEEIATWWAGVVGTDWEQKPHFRQNFERNFLEKLGKEHTIKSLDKCNFSQIATWINTTREERKNRSTEEKKAEREAKALVDEQLGFALVDGVREKISSYLVEPPGLFRGRGEHPKAGHLKTRLTPEDITINTGKDSMVPRCPIPGHAWKNVVQNEKVTWLAYYKDPYLSFSNVKYVYLAASSKFKGLSDKFKYEKARKLKSLVAGIRENYYSKVKSENETMRQLGTALYLIDRLALRVGNEKSEDEADTVGCCSLRVEHIHFEEDERITLDFLGKDSMRYFNTVQVEACIYHNLRQFTAGKSPEDDLFDKISTSSLNDYLHGFMEGLSAKVFRTYNASVTLQQELKKKPAAADVEDKVKFYTDANREVAILCNHQKSTPKNFGVQMEKMQDKLKGQLEKLELYKGVLKALKGGGKMPDLGEEKAPANVESCEKAVSRLKSQIKSHELRLKMKDDNKTVALGTSKMNYMDPRITVSWCKLSEVPIEKVFPKTVRNKFIWAMYVEPDWEF